VSQTLTPSMRRSILIAALRDEALQDGHKWNFCHFPGCAVGLADRLFNLSMIPKDGRTKVENPLDIMEQYFGVWEPFGCDAYPVADEHVTPAMVADHLEAIHRELEAAGK
jgi:hypothetical protein